MRVSIYRWGGHPVTSTNQGGPTLAEDLAVFRCWASLFCDPAAAHGWSQFATAGKAWLEGPSTDSSRRLLLRAFYERCQGERGVWYFFGITLEVESITPSVWVTALNRLVTLEKEALEEITGELSIPQSPLSDTRGGCESPYGRTYTGNYPEILNSLCNALSCCNWDELSRISIASHPPRSLEGFSTVILSDDFPLKNIVIKEELSQPAKDTSPTQKAVEAASGQSRFRSIFIGRHHVWWVLLSFFVGLTIGISRGRSGIERLKRENDELRLDSHNLRVEVLRHLQRERTVEKPVEKPSSDQDGK